MQYMLTSAFLLCVLSTCGQFENGGDGVFRVEIVAITPKKTGPEIALALGRGFVDLDGGKISNARLKEVYLTPRKSNKKNDECVLLVQFHQSDKGRITVDFLFKHIDTIRLLRDKKVNTYIYIITD